MLYLTFSQEVRNLLDLASVFLLYSKSWDTVANLFEIILWDNLPSYFRLICLLLGAPTLKTYWLYNDVLVVAVLVKLACKEELWHVDCS